ncbi:MAG: hypothetical protein IPN19_00865 [Elusimicrobia bacterium]|nr:hypothetical protein [Elusimicrobiota bacterium]
MSKKSFSGIVYRFLKVGLFINLILTSNFLKAVDIPMDENKWHQWFMKFSRINGELLKLERNLLKQNDKENYPACLELFYISGHLGDVAYRIKELEIARSEMICERDKQIISKLLSDVKMNEKEQAKNNIRIVSNNASTSSSEMNKNAEVLYELTFDFIEDLAKND